MGENMTDKNHCIQFGVEDIYHAPKPPRMVLSTDPCFGNTDFERLSGFLAWCMAHGISTEAIKMIKFSEWQPRSNMKFKEGDKVMVIQVRDGDMSETYKRFGV